MAKDLGSPMLSQSVQWGENYVSRALNIKFAGILKPGIYKGYRLMPAGIMTVRVEHNLGEDRSIALVERDGYTITIIMDAIGEVRIPARGEWYICIEACYRISQSGYQRIVARQAVEAHHVVLGKVIAENDTSEPAISITPEMVTEENRQNSELITQEQYFALRDQLSILIEWSGSGDTDAILGRLIAMQATVLHLTRRVTELELTILGNTDPQTGSYSGPVAVGSTMAAMGHCGMLVLTAPVVEPVGNPSETPPNSHDGDQGENQ